MLDIQKYIVDLQFIVNQTSETFDYNGNNQIFEFILDKLQDFKQIKNYPNQIYGNSLYITNTQSTEIDVLLLVHSDTMKPLTATEITDNQLQETTSLDEEKNIFTMINNNAYGVGIYQDKANLLLAVYIMLALKDIDRNIGLFIHSDNYDGCKESSKYIEQLSQNSKYCLSLGTKQSIGNFVDKIYGKLVYKISFSNSNSYNQSNMSTMLEACRLVKFLDILQNNKTELNILVSENNSDTLDHTPTYTEIVIQLRYLEHITKDKLIEKLENYREKYCHNEISIDYKELYFYPPMQASNSQLAIKRILQKECDKYHLECNWTSSYDLSASAFASLEKNCAVLDGLGVIGTKSPKESIDLSKINTMYNMLVNTILQISK